MYTTVREKKKKKEKERGKNLPEDFQVDVAEINALSHVKAVRVRNARDISSVRGCTVNIRGTPMKIPAVLIQHTRFGSSARPLSRHFRDTETRT